MRLLDANGRPYCMNPDAAPAPCTHGVTFDEDAARALLSGWTPKTDVDFIMGNPASAEIKKRWPRGWFDASHPRPLGCGFTGIAYASMAHYTMGDW